LWRAQIYKERLGADYGPALLAALKTPGKRQKSHGLAEKVAALPFQHFLTTNYESVLCEAIQKMKKVAPAEIDAQEPAVMRKFLANLHNRGPSVIFLHGRTADPSSIVLCEADY